MVKHQPIGVFDSGLGGLTVLQEINRLLPSENLLYLGDTARVPYGSKSQETIKKYSIENSLFLIKNEVKAIVVACNTASAFALNWIQDLFQIPIIGVIIPGAIAALEKSRNNHIGVFGTKGTINSSAYQQAINHLSSEAHVSSLACPLLVPLVEEGWNQSHITKQIIEFYWEKILEQDKNIDTLILGCTHYPLIKEKIKEVIGEIELVDSAIETARSLQKLLQEKELLNSSKTTGKISLCVTDDVSSFKKTVAELIQLKPDSIEKVFLDD